jgi:DNA replication and repair protein RecF
MLDPFSEARRSPMVQRLQLSDFRSYAGLDLALSGHTIVLTGENGAGKTNVLEALSLFSPGRGLRRADLADHARDRGGGGWAVAIELVDAGASIQLGTGLEPAQDLAGRQRKYRIERSPVASASAFADYLRVVWLTPAMDGLFLGSAGERRRFLDRLVLAVDAGHATRVGALERALRNRNRLLEMGSADRAWLDAAEREVAELAVAVAAARHETIARLSQLIAAERDETAVFPFAEIALAGDLESWLASASAVAVEDRYRGQLRDSRARDAAAGRTLLGPHLSDLVVRHGPKAIEAARASTGEQKALLLGLVLAHARLVAAMSGLAPLVLLDEIVAHFDPRRRSALFAQLRRLGAQVWLTGAEARTFAELEGSAQMLHVEAGAIVPLVAG